VSADSRKAQPRARLDFPEWEAVLAATALPERAKESHAITVRWYLSWCRRGQVAVDHESARGFVEWTAAGTPATWQQVLRDKAYGSGGGGSVKAKNRSLPERFTPLAYSLYSAMPRSSRLKVRVICSR
jgi:hypothetical protein